jgi:hypothetical protein
LQAQFDWLEGWQETASFLAGLNWAKVGEFAAYARNLKPSELSSFLPAKRYPLLLCLLHKARATRL